MVVTLSGVNLEYARTSSLREASLYSSASNVQASESLLKLVLELKRTAVFSGFASLNDHGNQRTDELNKLAENTHNILASIGEETAGSLKELESHYYSSTLRTSILQ